MSFITWWFETHWIWATFLTPGFSFLYAIFTDATGWAIGCLLWWLACHGALKGT